MTKEEKIKEAYREWWDKMKNFVDENGWFNKNAFPIINLRYEDVSATVDFTHDGSTDEMIPKEIQGIRDNNGWIKIESESDLPKHPWTKYDTCWSRRIDGFISIVYIKDLTHDNHSHWKETETPEPPIY